MRSGLSGTWEENESRGSGTKWFRDSGLYRVRIQRGQEGGNSGVNEIARELRHVKYVFIWKQNRPKIRRDLIPANIRNTSSF